MISENVINKAKEYFPDLKIKFKDESLFMKILSYILFFNKYFMTDYTTTIGSTIYYPSRKKIDKFEISSIIVLLHELVHIYDAKKVSKPLFSFLYLIPQSLVLLLLPLFFLLDWTLVLPLILLCLLPLPAYFRMVYEKRAYMVSMYVMNVLSKKMNFKYDVDKYSKEFLSYFKSSFYYFMWVFPDLDKKFEEAAAKIKIGERPYEDKVIDIIDNILKEI
jgi:hypothetical protein